MNSPQGYIIDARYPTTYIRELAPNWLNYVAALNGTLPSPLDQPFAYLELGCGAGFSSLTHAAAFPFGAFHACDFNRDGIAIGKQHARARAIDNIRFHEVSFDKLQTKDLPDFEFIVLHGVYTWVGEDVQRSIRQLIRDRLKPGGLVYVSYNCLPGWTSEVPLQKLIVELAEGLNGDSLQRTEQAIFALQRLSDSGLQYFRDHPSATTALAAYRCSERSYLAHEFLNSAWKPRYSIDVAVEMAEAEVRYVGSATLVDNHAELIIDATVAKAIAALDTTRQKQLATDFAVNRQFRRDVFVRARCDASPIGVAEIGAAEIDVAESLSRQTIGCPGAPDTINTTVQVPRGSISFHDDFICELRALMTLGPTTLGELVTTLSAASRSEKEIARNLLYLIAAGTLTPSAKPLR